MTTTRMESARRRLLPTSLVVALIAGLATPLPSTARAQAVQPPAQPQAAQPGAQGAGPVEVDAQPALGQAEWTKVCNKDDKGGEQCFTTRDFVAAPGQPVLSIAVYESRGGPQVQQTVRLLLPLGLALVSGVRVSVDQGPAVSGTFAVCLPTGCFAEGVLREDFVARMKSGTVVTVRAQNTAGKDVTVRAPLSGFGKAMDGPAIDSAVLAEREKRAKEELEKRSDALRQRIEQPTVKR